MRFFLHWLWAFQHQAYTERYLEAREEHQRAMQLLLACSEVNQKKTPPK